VKAPLWILLCVTLAGCITRPVSVSPFPAKNIAQPPFGAVAHFDVVSEDSNIYRGGQPTHEGFQFLKQRGVKTILKLDSDTEGNDLEAELIGFEVVKIPINLKKQLFGPVPVEAIKQFWAQHPRDVFVHCVHGQDRTGLAVYLYERAQSVSKESATSDMLSHGFHKTLFSLWKEAKAH
jgi:protein tyrosine/serine phosphatase